MRRELPEIPILESRLNFYDKDDEILVGEVPLDGVKHLPRVGDIVLLSKTTGQYDGGYYKVTHIIHYFTERGVDADETVLLSITAVVRRAEGTDMPERALEE